MRQYFKTNKGLKIQIVRTLDGRKLKKIYHDKPETAFRYKLERLRKMTSNINKLSSQERENVLQAAGFRAGQYKMSI